ncbi:MAG: PTS sugar transporter subunit IIA [Gemmataceae bacterium]
MRMTDFIVRDAITPSLSVATKEGVIREMVGKLKAAGYFKDQNEEIVQAVLKRERLGSTGIGKGVAIPHAKHTSVDRMVGAIAVAPKGIDFESVDSEPVHVLVMLISPEGRPRDHLLALQNVASSLKDERLVDAIKKATTSDEIWKLLSEDRG